MYRITIRSYDFPWIVTTVTDNREGLSYYNRSHFWEVLEVEKIS